MVKVEEEMEQIRFAERAARYFALHQDMAAYSDNGIDHGCFLASVAYKHLTLPTTPYVETLVVHVCLNK